MAKETTTPEYQQAVRGDGAIDMAGLREISDEDYEDEYGEGSEDDSTDIDGEDDDSALAAARKVSKEEQEEESGEEEDSEEGEAEGSEGDETEEDEDADSKEGDDEEEEEGDDSFLLGLDADGKEVRIPKGAKFEVVVNGETVEMTAEEMRNRASGATHIQNESSRLGRVRVELEQREESFQSQKKAWEDEVEKANVNLEMFANASPEEFFYQYAQLTGRRPSDVYQEFMEKALKHAQDFANMDPATRMRLDDEARRKTEQRRFELDKKRFEDERRIQEEQRQFSQFLDSSGVDIQEFDQAFRYLQEHVPKEHHGNISPQQVVEQVHILRQYGRTVESMKTVDEGLLQNGDLVQRVYYAVARTESLTGRQMTDEEIQGLIREAAGLGAPSKPKNSESLSTKVDRAKKSGKTNSKSASSRKRKEEDGYADTLTLGEHRDRIRSLG